MRALLAMGVVVLAGCGQPAADTRAPSEGGAARAEMENAVLAFAGCIDEQAKTMPVETEAAGRLAINAVTMCKGLRETLVEKVAAFNALGYPNRTPAQLERVAEASVKILEDEARQAAVVTIVQRQLANGDGAATAPAADANADANTGN